MEADGLQFGTGVIGLVSGIAMAAVVAAIAGRHRKVTLGINL